MNTVTEIFIIINVKRERTKKKGYMKENNDYFFVCRNKEPMGPR